ncbi:MAG: hypothetical protein AB1442_09410 [Nitrospirota bacterium]
MAGKPGFRSSEACSVKKCHGLARGYLQVEAKDNLLSIDAQNVELADLLKEIEKVAGIKVILRSGLISKNVSAYYENLTNEYVFKEILHEYSYVLTLSQDTANSKNILKEVIVETDVVGSKLHKEEIISIEIPYGTKLGELGVVDEGEGALGGPPSFAVDKDKDGTILILDPLNKHPSPLDTPVDYLLNY